MSKGQKKPIPFSKNGRNGKIYPLRSGCFKTYFIFAHKVHQNTFSTLENALVYLGEEFDKIDSDTANSAQLFPLDRDRKHYWELEQRLKVSADGTSLWEAVDFFITYNKRKKHNPTSVADCASKFISQSAVNGASTPQIKTLKKHFKRFVQDFGGRMIHTIDCNEVSDWLNSQEDKKSGSVWSPKTRKSVRGSLVSLARYARKQLKAIPSSHEETEFEKVPTPKTKSCQEVGIYTPAELEKILMSALKEDVDLIPIIVLGAWCGLRPAEAHGEDVDRSKLEWSAFDWEEKSLTLFNQKVRTNRPRTIPVQSAPEKWLSPFMELQGPIWSFRSSFDRRFAAIRETAGVRNCPNGLRHSYASYRIKQLTGNLEALAEEMGNSPDEITRSYKRGVPSSESNRWFGITPPEGYEEKISLALQSHKKPQVV